jgi:outer membrane immunogenic protein
MKKVLLTSVAALGVAILPLGAADAADYSAAPVFNWSGFYAGLHGGFLNADVTITEDITVAGTASGFIGGAYAGYNFPPMMAPNLVLGVEADVGFGDINKPAPPILPDEADDVFGYNLDWNAHFRGRIGLPIGDGNIMPFVAGGLALAGFHVRQETLPVGGTYVGGTIGAGVDVAFSPSLVGLAEVLWDCFADKTYTFGSDEYTAHLSTFTARIGIAYQFPP